MRHAVAAAMRLVVQGQNIHDRTVFTAAYRFRRSPRYCSVRCVARTQGFSPAMYRLGCRLRVCVISRRSFCVATPLPVITAARFSSGRVQLGRVQQSRMFGCWPLRNICRAGYVGLSGMTSAAVIIHTTAPDHEVASSIAKKLVQDKLAACVQTIKGNLWTSRLRLSSAKQKMGLKDRLPRLQGLKALIGGRTKSRRTWSICFS